MSNSNKGGNKSPAKPATDPATVEPQGEQQPATVIAVEAVAPGPADQATTAEASGAQTEVGASSEGAAGGAAEEAAVETAVLNPGEVSVWPVRTYQDAGELKRRGGPSYNAPRRHAEALHQRGLVSLEDPKA